jgi:hypothetical protein
MVDLVDGCGAFIPRVNLQKTFYVHGLFSEITYIGRCLLDVVVVLVVGVQG